MKCRFCGEGDEEKLCLDMIAVEGRVVDDSAICTHCLGILIFGPKVNDGRAILSQREANAERIFAARGIDSFQLRE